MSDIRVGKRSVIVIPAELRRRLGISEGDILHAEVDEHGRLVLEPVPSDPAERLRRAGAAVFAGVDGLEYERGLREEWER